MTTLPDHVERTVGRDIFLKALKSKDGRAASGNAASTWDELVVRDPTDWDNHIAATGNRRITFFLDGPLVLPSQPPDLASGNVTIDGSVNGLGERIQIEKEKTNGYYGWGGEILTLGAKWGPTPPDPTANVSDVCLYNLTLVGGDGEYKTTGEACLAAWGATRFYGRALTLVGGNDENVSFGFPQYATFEQCMFLWCRRHGHDKGQHDKGPLLSNWNLSRNNTGWVSLIRCYLAHMEDRMGRFGDMLNIAEQIQCVVFDTVQATQLTNRHAGESAVGNIVDNRYIEGKSGAQRNAGDFGYFSTSGSDGTATISYYLDGNVVDPALDNTFAGGIQDPLADHPAGSTPLARIDASNLEATVPYEAGNQPHGHYELLALDCLENGYGSSTNNLRNVEAGHFCAAIDGGNGYAELSSFDFRPAQVRVRFKTTFQVDNWNTTAGQWAVFRLFDVADDKIIDCWIDDDTGHLYIEYTNAPATWDTSRSIWTTVDPIDGLRSRSQFSDPKPNPAHVEIDAYIYLNWQDTPDQHAIAGSLRIEHDEYSLGSIMANTQPRSFDSLPGGNGGGRVAYGTGGFRGKLQDLQLWRFLSPTSTEPVIEFDYSLDRTFADQSENNHPDIAFLGGGGFSHWAFM